MEIRPLALAQLAPGPLAAQLAIYLGWVRGGVLGATLAALLPRLAGLSAAISSYTRDARGWYTLSAGSQALRYAAAAVLLAPLTLLMGGTLTLLIRHLVAGDLGRAGARIGALYGGVELAESEGIAHAGGYAWGTANSVRAIERAVRQVRACFPDTPRLFVGDLSREHGGWLGPHASHQAGLDADIGYFYVGPPLWYQRATAKNLDVPRTRALLKALVEGGNVEMIFVDRSVQTLLKRAANEPESDELLDEAWFEGPLKRDTIIRHAWGHATHFHVRFTDPDATALGTRLVQLLPVAHPLRRIFPGTAKR